MTTKAKVEDPASSHAPVDDGSELVPVFLPGEHLVFQVQFVHVSAGECRRLMVSGAKIGRIPTGSLRGIYPPGSCPRNHLPISILRNGLLSITNYQILFQQHQTLEDGERALAVGVYRSCAL